MQGLKALEPYTQDPVVRAAYQLMIPIVPELKDSTAMMRMAQLCTERRAASGVAMAFLCDTLRALRVVGQLHRSSRLTVHKLTGQNNTQPALAHRLFKLDDLADVLWREAQLQGPSATEGIEMSRTPGALLAWFEEDSEAIIVAEFRSSAPCEGLPVTFLHPFEGAVANHREMKVKDEKATALQDMFWELWSGVHDETIDALCAAELESTKSASGGFVYGTGN